MITILFVHQGAELYGSDKVLLNIVKGLDKNKYTPIVALPEEGPLVDELKKVGIDVYFIPVVKISRKIYRPKCLLMMPFCIFNAVNKMNRVFDGKRIDIVHSNTLAVLVGAVWAMVMKVQHIWHVHEIISDPMPARKVFPLLIRLFADQVLCNSAATGNWLIGEQRVLKKKMSVIWNGIEEITSPDSMEVQKFRDDLKISSDDLLLTLAGRINWWKGQKIFVDVAKKIIDEGYCNVRFLIIGGVFTGQEHIKKELDAYILHVGVSQYVKIINFIKNIEVALQATDIAVVPSTEPEPFGMVAIEAMRAGKPVVASNHGGLREIVEHRTTGLLFPPGDVISFAKSLIELIKNPDLRCAMGKAGKKRQEKLFSVKAQINQICKCYTRENGR